MINELIEWIKSFIIKTVREDITSNGQIRQAINGCIDSENSRGEGDGKGKQVYRGDPASG